MARRTISITVDYPSGVDWPTAWHAIVDRVNVGDGLMLSAAGFAVSVGNDDGGEVTDARRVELLKDSPLGCEVLAGKR